MTLLTSLPAARGEADAPTFFVFPISLYYARRFVNRFFRKISELVYIFAARGNTNTVPVVQKMEVYLMDNTKNTKNTTENTESTSTKNGKNAKGGKSCK